MTTPPSYTKHTTHTDALDTLGTIIGPDETRDAVHIAVYPTEAAERLNPGDNVKLNNEGKAVWTQVGEGSGIVDPFLCIPVFPGQRFWLFVYPRQITSLRHVWEHPSFPASKDPADVVLDSVIKEANEDAKAASERWLRDWIDGADCPDFFTTIGAMLAQRDGGSGDGYWDGDSVHFSGTDAHGSIPPEAWHHLGIFVGEDLSGDRPTHFTCSC